MTGNVHAGSARQALLNSRKTVTQAAVQFRDKAMQESARAPAVSQAGLPPMGALLPQCSPHRLHHCGQHMRPTARQCSRCRQPVVMWK